MHMAATTLHLCNHTHTTPLVHLCRATTTCHILPTRRGKSKFACTDKQHGCTRPLYRLFCAPDNASCNSSPFSPARRKSKKPFCKGHPSDAHDPSKHLDTIPHACTPSGPLDLVKHYVRCTASCYVDRHTGTPPLTPAAAIMHSVEPSKKWLTHDRAGPQPAYPAASTHHLAHMYSAGKSRQMAIVRTKHKSPPAVTSHTVQSTAQHWICIRTTGRRQTPVSCRRIACSPPRMACETV